MLFIPLCSSGGTLKAKQMNTIGIRVEPSAVTFVVYNAAENQIVNVEKIKVPKALNVPEGLKFVRVNILDVLREYQIVRAGVRITESNAQTLKISRIQIEGVVIEAFASSSLEGYYCGQISSVSKLLQIERTDCKKYMSGELDYPYVQNWGDLSQAEKEACLTAIGAVNA